MQAELFTLGRLRIHTDYGPVGAGASGAHYVRADNGSEYLIKGPSLNGALPYVAANELITVQLASILNLPVLDFRVIEHEGNLFFGSDWMQRTTFHPAITADLFDRALNKARCYDIVAFDYWVFNTDRHHENLLVRKDPARGNQEFILLNDHSHCLVQPGEIPDHLITHYDAAPPVRLDFVRDAITSAADLRGAISLIEGVPNSAISRIVKSTPTTLVNNAEKDMIHDFLIHRRENLLDLFSRSRTVFHRLKGDRI